MLRSIVGALVLAGMLSSSSAFAPASLPSIGGRAASAALPLRRSQSLGVDAAFGHATRRTTGGAFAALQMAAKKTFKSMDDMIENSELPILVDFYATWCGPCVLMSRELATLSNDPDVKDRVSIVKIDTDKYPAIATKYEIAALPTCVLFKDGKPVERFEGAMQSPQIKELLLKKLD